MLTADIRELFRKKRLGRTIVITIGNSLRSDDGVGPYIAGLSKPVDDSMLVLDAKERPESIVDDAILLNPTTTIIIDAADFGGCPGEARLVPEKAISDYALSTHIFPIRLIARILADDTASRIYYLGIQPKNVGFGDALSPEVQKTADMIVDLINGDKTAMQS